MPDTILIVDDTPANRKLARVGLEDAGYAVHTAANATEAEARLAARTYPLVLMDIQLPDIDGLELTRRLKSDPRHAHTAIIAVTAYAMTGDRQKALAAGCDDYITKPIDIRALAHAVARFVPPRRSAP